MGKQNITLSLPKELLRKARLLAVQRNTSVSGLLAETLQELVHNDDAYVRAKLHHMSILSSGVDLQTNGSITWDRDELHER